MTDRAHVEQTLPAPLGICPLPHLAHYVAWEGPEGWGLCSPKPTYWGKTSVFKTKISCVML